MGLGDSNRSQNRGKGRRVMEKKSLWIVLWQASNSAFPVGIFEGKSAEEAIGQCVLRTEFGSFFCTSNELFAEPAGTDEKAAWQRYKALFVKADQDQQAATLVAV